METTHKSRNSRKPGHEGKLICQEINERIFNDRGSIFSEIKGYATATTILSEYAFAVSPLSSSMMSPKSRWRILKHVVVATLRFQGGLGRDLPSGSSRISTTTQTSFPSLVADLHSSTPFEASAYSVSQSNSPYWFDDSFRFPSPFSIDDLAQSPVWLTQERDPPFDFSPPLSRWRLVKHVVMTTVRLQSIVKGRRSSSRGMKTAMQLETSLPNLPDLELKSIIETDEISGKVYRVVHRQTGQTYALKEFPDDSSQRQQISGEVQILKELDHPNLVKCCDVVFGDAGVSFLLLEPLDRGSSNVTTESDLVSFAYQLLLGLTFLHRNKIWHGDITPANIFVGHTGQVKLLYLGKTLSKAPAFSAAIGAIHDRFSWDIWSVGLCILKLSRDLRFSEDVPAAELIQKQPLNLDLSLFYIDTSLNEGALLWKQSTKLLSFLSACMQTDVLKRWTAEQLVHHPFFDQLPLKKEVQFPLKKEVQLPPLKKEVQLPQTELQMIQTSEYKKKEILSHEREEVMSPIKKKPKISMEDRVYDLESPKDSTSGVPHEVPENASNIANCFFQIVNLKRINWYEYG